MPVNTATSFSFFMEALLYMYIVHVKLYNILIPAAAETVEMCSATEQHLTGAHEVNLSMKRTISPALPISCTCLITSHWWSIMTISRQINPNANNTFNRQNCQPNSGNRGVYMKECTFNNCTEASYSRHTSNIQQDSAKNVTANWMIVSFTWNNCTDRPYKHLGFTTVRGDTLLS